MNKGLLFVLGVAAGAGLAMVSTANKDIDFKAVGKEKIDQIQDQLATLEKKLKKEN